ncbi:hypothetical protein NYZ00_16370 [Acinetobacter baumannii]|uniref:hypothetical protein n=1 Tax=Acinetobacter baumannii TaxID=470 RepID=UPI000CE394B5|nr:hypothetical protein [Acinetobacter baumannii]MCW1515634.1 hypothetical protein [Acinetobacter baumannii]MCZ3099555.1 hypothetical protein [Acinetobacter baumannii]MDH2650331.1 hypothetical protein [Acinetobacter baumannii]PPB89878.1 hypothetical protein AbaMCR9238_13225 [Acinetobacter baumannii]PPC15092.1 hypothetical protein AbaMCR10172_14480 [Acinetobacter baumannii]
MSCSEILSIVANLCTIAAFVIAFYVWWTWKDQQNYSFVRDKIFESELAIIDILTSLSNTTQIYGECKRIYLVNKLNSDPQFLREDFKASEAEFKQYAYKYKAAINKLIILKVPFDRNIIIDFEHLLSKWDNYKKEIHGAENAVQLQNTITKILSEIKELNKESLKHLSCVRYSI